jgi:hypothetical protein
MAKVTGATLEFWYGGQEYPVNSVSFDGAWDEIETTDSATPTPATDFILNRAKRTSKVDMDLTDVDAALKVVGALTAGARYRLQLGAIVETTISHNYNTVGKIWTSDGTGTASASNQVYPLGAKLPGKSIICAIGGANTAVTSMKYDENYGEFDATDSNTTGDGTEWITGRRKATASLELIMQDTVADLLIASPAAQAVILTFGTGLTLTGSAIFQKKSINSLAKGDMVKVAYDLVWVGSVTSTLARMLPMGASTAVIARWKGWGASTQKQISGNAIVMSKSIEADVNSICKVSYGLAWVGAPTEAIYS